MIRETVVQVWDDLEAAGGSIVIPQVLYYQAGTAVKRIDNNDTLTVVAPRDTWWRSTLAIRQVVRVTDPINVVTEWRISQIVDGRGFDEEPLVTITAEPILLDLTNVMIQHLQSGGITAYDLGGVQQTIAEYIDSYVLDSLADVGQTYWQRGTVADTAGLYDIAWPGYTCLELLQDLTSRANNGQGADLWVSRDGGSGIDINIGDRGASATTVRAEFDRGLSSVIRTQSLQELVTVVLPRGGRVAGAIDLATCAMSAWEVTALDADTPSTGTDRVTVVDPSDNTLGPLAYDDQVNGNYILEPDATLTEITDSQLSGTTHYLFVADSSGLTVGDHIEIRKDSSGSHITEIAHPTNSLPPSSGGLGRVLRIVDDARLRGERNHTPNNEGADWASGNLPDGWSTSGTPPTGGDMTHQRDRTLTNPGTGAADGTQGPSQSVLVKGFPANYVVQAGDAFDATGKQTLWVTDNVTLDGSGGGTVTIHSSQSFTNNDTITITPIDISGSAGSDYAIYHRHWDAGGGPRVVTPSYTVRYDATNTTLWASAGFSVWAMAQTNDITGTGKKPLLEIWDIDGASVLQSVESDTLSFSGTHNPVHLVLRISHTMTADLNVELRVKGATENFLNNQDDDYGSAIRWVTLHLGPDPRIPVIRGSHANTLWHLGNNWLTSSVQTRYDVTLKDLAAINSVDPYADETLVLGGDVRVVDDVLDIDVTARIVAIRTDFLNPLDTIVTLATNRPKGSALLLPKRFAPEVEQTAPIAFAETIVVNSDQSVTVTPGTGTGYVRVTPSASLPTSIDLTVPGVFT
jgi:hypothetical protein